MGVEDVVAKVRDHYVDGLRSSIARLKQTASDAVPELMLELGEGRRPRPYSLFRTDLISGGSQKPKITEFNQDSFLDFDPINFSLGHLSCRLHPFYWNGVEIKAIGLPTDWSRFECWVREWIDEADDRESDLDGLAAVIHSVMKPEIEGDHWTTSIDFGSASPETFWNLLELLESLGVRSVELGSFSMMTPPCAQGDGPGRS
jgi:hypothetical protein